MKNASRVYYYQIDTEGRLWHENSEITDPHVLNFFLRHLETTASGRLRVLCMGETNWIEAEDVPYIIQSIYMDSEVCTLNFSGNYHEVLMPQTLWVGLANVLYCKVRQGQFTARFNRKAYMQLSAHIEADLENGFFLKLGAQKYPILIAAEK